MAVTWADKFLQAAASGTPPGGTFASTVTTPEWEGLMREAVTPGFPYVADLSSAYTGEAWVQDPVRRIRLDVTIDD